MSYVKGGYLEQKKVAYKKYSIWAGIGVYLAMIGYTGWHNVQLMLRGVHGDGIVVAIGGIVALEVTACFLPLALKFWTLDWTHKIAAALFYVLDLALIGMNSFANFNVESGQQVPSWVTDYIHVIVPITPILCGIGWAILFALDPVSKVTARQAHNELESQLLYLDAQAQYTEEDANYRAMIEAKARRDQLNAGMRQFGITEKEPAKLPAAPANKPTRAQVFSLKGLVKPTFPADGGSPEVETEEEAGPEGGQSPFRFNSEVKPAKLRIMGRPKRR